MSHELRTPLNAIIGFSELLKSEIFGPLGDARYKGYIDDVFNSGKHLLSLVNDVLDFSKIDAGALQLNEEHVNLRETLVSTLRMLDGQAAQAGVSLEHEVARDLPTLLGDERRVRQVLLNLLSNARQIHAPRRQGAADRLHGNERDRRPGGRYRHRHRAGTYSPLRWNGSVRWMDRWSANTKAPASACR